MANRGGGRDAGNEQMDTATTTSSTHHHFNSSSSANLTNDMGIILTIRNIRNEIRIFNEK